MARKKIDSDRFFLRPAELMLLYLEDVKKLGTFGKTEQEVALNLIGRCIESLIKDGRIKRRTQQLPEPQQKNS